MTMDSEKLQDFIDTIKEVGDAAKAKSAAEIENTFRSILETELTELQRRIEDLETTQTAALPISQLTPNDGIEEVKKTLNYLINYLNIGIKR